ncbi:hypothetical protein GTA08_BOTSDO09169 [Botryosphaeria dothidea]|uniref:Uncharacterized protein n=1 Tax=Botryosphaeria dothidea TaxID=55169 RepID=A0A8H4IMF7_9PEZI|nr:hypothetical protein GTA08_BOTSDO09169 [Botryosphaeria dothidea]
MHVNAVAFFTLALTGATFVTAAPAESPTSTTKDPATPVINEEPSKQCSIIQPFGWIDTPCDWKTCIHFHGEKACLLSYCEARDGPQETGQCFCTCGEYVSCHH